MTRKAVALGASKALPILMMLFVSFSNSSRVCLVARAEGQGDGSGSGKLFRISPASLVGMLVVVVLVYAAFGVYQVDQQERGVVFRFGKVQSETKEAGLQWNWPLVDVVEKVNVTRVNTSEHSGTMLTEDENIVEINLAVQYVVSDPVKNLVEIRNPEESLKHATESAP